VRPVDDDGVQRRLAAVLSADMVGYSRLMEIDETGTLARLKAHRLELIDPAIAKANGRIIKTTGDGMLVEFRSVVDAVRAAVEIQARMARRNADVGDARRIDFRIGINLGDLIVEDGDIFGDGVNLAARLQELAEPGGICVSRAVRDQVGERADCRFEDLGERTVKNIARPIGVVRVVPEGQAQGGAPSRAAPQAAAPPPAAALAPARGDKASLVVLPLLNMSGDPEQEFFADGMTEDIITELSRFRDLEVISRNTSFVYKGKAVRVSDVARELGVQYVVEGSVRKAGNRVRITVQLIEATQDKHIWAERYDRDLEHLFELQDEVTSSIAATLPGRLEAVARDRAAKKPTENMTAYECVLAGKVLHHRRTREDNAKAQALLDRAVALDPNFAHAHAWRACVLGQAWTNGYTEDREATWQQVLAELRQAQALDDDDSDVHRILAAVSMAEGNLERAAYHQDRALGLNPNDDLIVVQQGELLTLVGRPEEGAEWIRKAMRLNPYHPERFWGHLGRALLMARRHGEAVDAYRRIAAPDVPVRAYLAAALAHAGDDAGARRAVTAILEAQPDFTVEAHMRTLRLQRAEDLAHVRDGLLAAGAPAGG